LHGNCPTGLSQCASSSGRIHVSFENAGRTGPTASAVRFSLSWAGAGMERDKERDAARARAEAEALRRRARGPFAGPLPVPARVRPVEVYVEERDEGADEAGGSHITLIMLRRLAGVLA
jgi:hypothetical protein